MRATCLLLGLSIWLAAGCASPADKARQAALQDYNRTQREVAAYARAKVNLLTAATKMFRSSVGRWPQTYQEFGNYIAANSLPFDMLAFNDVTFSTLKDGSLQIYYDVNCSGFNTKQYQFTQTGTVNIKTK
ncbi:MAG TPA: hypothetical protein VMV72_13750 [Verrucomicrobiae bacterium]|nr:hypothetical protein [Verrucomicrobiae bacterium]